MSLNASTKRKLIWKILTKENGISVTPQSSNILMEKSIFQESDLLSYLHGIVEMCKFENGKQSYFFSSKPPHGFAPSNLC